MHISAAHQQEGPAHPSLWRLLRVDGVGMWGRARRPDEARDTRNGSDLRNPRGRARIRLRRARLESELRTFLGRPNPFDDDQDDYWTTAPETAEPTNEQLARMRANILAAISDRPPLEETVCNPDTPRRDLTRPTSAPSGSASSSAPPKLQRASHAKTVSSSDAPRKDTQ